MLGQRPDNHQRADRSGAPDRGERSPRVGVFGPWKSKRFGNDSEGDGVF